MTGARKISFQEAWDSSVVFFVDEELEQEIETEVESLLATARSPGTPHGSISDLAGFLLQQKNALDVVVKDLELSQEKFMRIMSLLRKLGRIPGGFDREWGMSKIKNKIAHDVDFARVVAQLLLDGKRDAVSLLCQLATPGHAGSDCTEACAEKASQKGID